MRPVVVIGATTTPSQTLSEGGDLRSLEHAWTSGIALNGFLLFKGSAIYTEDYRSARLTADRYQVEILPRPERTYTS
jgi:hypothetical protein